MMLYSMILKRGKDDGGKGVYPGYVKTIREEIFFEYAKLISRSTLKGNVDYPFVANRFKALLKGRVTMADMNREWPRGADMPPACVYCGSATDLDLDYLIPLSRGGSRSSDNTVLSCPDCRSSRGEQGIFRWLGLEKKESLDPFICGRYLKELFDAHSQKGTLEIHKHAITLLCPGCGNADACRKWEVVEELTCLCLESAF
jgi:hypothetical protein